MSKLVVFGGIVLDYLCKVEDASKDCAQVVDYREGLGGMGYNTASAAAKLGIETELVGAVGGGFIRSWGEKNLKLTLTKVKGLQTTTSFLFYDGSKEKVYFFRGPYHDYDDKNANKAIKNSEFVHFAGVLPKFPEYAESARKEGKIISFNPGYDLFHYDPKDKIVLELLKHSDILILNKNEFERLRVPAEELGKNKKAVIVTKGKKGCSIFENGKQTDMGIIPANVKSPFGAGDAFTGGFLAAVAKGHGVVQAAKIATSCSSFAVGVEGTAPGLNWEKVVERSKNL